MCYENFIIPGDANFISTSDCGPYTHRQSTPLERFPTHRKSAPRGWSHSRRDSPMAATRFSQMFFISRKFRVATNADLFYPSPKDACYGEKPARVRERGSIHTPFERCSPVGSPVHFQTAHPQTLRCMYTPRAASKHCVAFLRAAERKFFPRNAKLSLPTRLLETFSWVREGTSTFSNALFRSLSRTLHCTRTHAPLLHTNTLSDIHESRTAHTEAKRETRPSCRRALQAAFTTPSRLQPPFAVRCVERAVNPRIALKKRSNAALPSSSILKNSQTRSLYLFE
ncbi:hypothetical protein TGME49_249400 [Toxoplasma gondii ME49]|uniref:Uncharacterized protein n=3 Tax=Toxoplasma gondii TaxID=5811 RepID=B6KHF1_TOXGV|nr:hypothetical protein TGME49_249400 [Toxoplasma gondii ME49]EPT25094.1 hypothetical protein TGME49_249400 [Toxoplasma gondii ME49]ESS34421.1 hypothetical protein TGVEG_249400 [Toxoplasma gondii VEG]KYF49968.1 hypothetical protein TGARI_249400 [Toxoplasma gondii ARI]CEL78551.1 TPA: hypothetical protein BN1205_002460 [Toxoplasma gondii VEG]|eukprot:XP_002367274.1 hypothetical protein TGME49_249400 [Toxoplasma gondii ME49]